MTNHDALLSWIDVAARSDLGYDQGQRMSFLDLQNHRIRPHSETDCSALVAGVIALAGYPISLAAPVYTGSLLEKTEAIGYRPIPVRGMSVAQIQSRAKVGGEVLLNTTHHVIIQSRHIGSWLSANIDERGMASGGRAGNQTGTEVSLRRLWMYHAGWDYLLVPPETAGSASVAQNIGRFLDHDTTVALQKVLGTAPDGIVGPATIKALEARAGFEQDGRLDTPSGTIRKVQAYLNRFVGASWCHYGQLAVDGLFGAATAAAMKDYLTHGNGGFTNLAGVAA